MTEKSADYEILGKVKNERALIITPAGRRLMPEQVQAFFPPDIDGYLYLVDREDGKVEVWKHIYADDHPWKDRRDSNHFVEVIEAQAAKNMEVALLRWNMQGAAEDAKAEDIKATKLQQFQMWVDALPEKLYGFKREGEDLVDVWGNTVFHLRTPTLAFKTPEEIESAILNLIADGFEIE